MSDNDAIREHLKYYRDLGVLGTTTDPRWRERTGDSVAAKPVNNDSDLSPVAPAIDEAGAKGDSATELAAVRAFIGDCTRCKLHALGRRTVVFGTGNPDADLMFVGEAPGADEDEQGVPFVGRAGQLLTKIIEAIGLRRDDVYIANVIKCRPPGNRNPEPDEVATCEPFLTQQIDIVQPRVIVALGTFAAHLLLHTDAPISRIRGVVHRYRGASLIPTFHPAYLLRNPGDKRLVWSDIKAVLAELGLPVPLR
jgi:DNA polymerase